MTPEFVFEFIRSELGRRRMSLDEFCQKLGIERARYYRWEKKQDLPCSYLLKIAEVFETTPDVVIGMTRRW